MDVTPQAKSGIELPQGFEIVINPDHPTKIEILRDNQKYDLLTAYPDHPYCNKAENYFHDIFVKAGFTIATSRMHSNQTAILYLRNRETFLVETVAITVDIAQKFTGVKSGIIINPPEFAGIMCCPPKDKKGPWTAFRNYDRSYLKTSEEQGRHKHAPHIIPKHILNLPNVRPEKNHASRLTEKERRDLDFTKLPPNIVLAEKEFREYFVHSALAILPDTEPYWIKEISKGVDGEGDNYYIICKSPFAWRKLEFDHELDFALSTKDDSGKGYFEVIRGKVEKREGKLVFVPEKTPGKPELMTSEVFKIRPNPVKDGIEQTRHKTGATFIL